MVSPSTSPDTHDTCRAPCSASLDEERQREIQSESLVLLQTSEDDSDHEESKRICYWNHRHPSSRDLRDDHDNVLENFSSLLLPQPVRSMSTFPSNLKTTGLEECEYCNVSEEKHGRSTSAYDYERVGSSIPDVKSAMADTVKVVEEVVQLLKGQDEGGNQQYLPHSASILLTTLQNVISTRFETIDHRIIEDNVTGYDNDKFFYHALSLKKSLLHPSVDDDVNKKERGERTIEGDLDTQLIALDQMEANERKADKLLESIIAMDSDRGSCVPKGRTPLFRANALSIEETTFDKSAPLLDVDVNDDEDSIEGDIARLTQSITYLQRDLESADFSFLDDVQHDEISIGLNRWNNKWERLTSWLSESLILEQKLRNTFHDASSSMRDNLFAILSNANIELLFLMILILWMILAFVSNGDSLDEHYVMFADKWWLFQK